MFTNLNISHDCIQILLRGWVLTCSSILKKIFVASKQSTHPHIHTHSTTDKKPNHEIKSNQIKSNVNLSSTF
jgi:hypothetical protein